MRVRVIPPACHERTVSWLAEQTGDPADHSLDDLPCENQYVLDFFSRRRLVIPRIPKPPSKGREVPGAVEQAHETAVQPLALGRKLVEVMGFPKRAIVEGQETLQAERSISAPGGRPSP